MIMDKEIKLSAVIIAYNEEKNIGRCIDSLAGIADEIVVIDSHSTDKTADICREKGVRFIQHPFMGHIEQINSYTEYSPSGDGIRIVVRGKLPKGHRCRPVSWC